MYVCYDYFMKRVTLLAAMHGDETYGIDLHDAFISTYPELSDFIQLAIGNEEAYTKNVRYIDADMNRHYGDSSKTNESAQIRRVENEIALFHPDYILDIHTTRRDSGVFFISDTPNATRQRIYDMLEIDVCVIKDKVIKKSFIGNHTNAVSLEYSLSSISTKTTLAFVDALKGLIENSKVTQSNERIFNVSKLITKREWEKYPGLMNYDIKSEGTALMVPADSSEMDAEYYGFWCHKETGPTSVAL